MATQTFPLYNMYTSLYNMYTSPYKVYTCHSATCILLTLHAVSYTAKILYPTALKTTHNQRANLFTNKFSYLMEKSDG